MTAKDDQKWIADKSIAIIGALLVVIMGMISYINSVQTDAMMDALMEMKADYKVMRADLAQVKIHTAPVEIRLTSLEKKMADHGLIIDILKKKISDHILIDEARYKNIGAE